MMQKRLLRSLQSFDYSAQSINESKELNAGKVILEGIIQKADTLNQNGRIYPRDILQREINNYQKLIIENRATGECVPPGTEIFTFEGWKKIEDITEDEKIYTLNLETNQIEVLQIDEKICRPHDGELLSIKTTRSIDMTITPGHKIVLWDRKHKPYKILASDFEQQCQSSKIYHSYLQRSGIWEGKEIKLFNLPNTNLVIDMFDWLAFLGIYLAEGCVDGTKRGYNLSHTIQITQKNAQIITEIRNLLTRLPWQFKEHVRDDNETIDFIIVDKELHTYLFELGNSRTKYIPNDFKQLSKPYLKTMLDWMLKGDGLHRKCKKYDLLNEYATASKKLADDVFELMFKLGTSASITTRQPKNKKAPDFNKTGRMILAENQVDMNIIHQHYSKAFSWYKNSFKIKRIPYAGNVYCVRNKNGTWLMRQNNKITWTSNCDHPDSSVISLKNVSHKFLKVWMEGNIVYGRIQILNTPSGKILQDLLGDGVKLGISSRGVGSTERRGEYHVVQDDFQIICWDMVSEPSTPGAFMLPTEGSAYMPEGKLIVLDESLYDDNTNLKLETKHNKQSNTLDDLIKDILTNNKAV